MTTMMPILIVLNMITNNYRCRTTMAVQQTSTVTLARSTRSGEGSARWASPKSPNITTDHKKFTKYHQISLKMAQKLNHQILHTLPTTKQFNPILFTTGRLWRGLESHGPEIFHNCGCEEDLWCLSQQNWRSTHVQVAFHVFDLSLRKSSSQGNRLSERVWEPPKHHPAAERAPGGQRQGPLPRLRVHGDRPPPRDQEGQHPQGHPQTVHHVPAVQGDFFLKYFVFKLNLFLILVMARQLSSYTPAMWFTATRNLQISSSTHK